MGNELWSGQAQIGVNSDFEVKFDLEGQGQLPPPPPKKKKTKKTIGTLTNEWYIQEVFTIQSCITSVRDYNTQHIMVQIGSSTITTCRVVSHICDVVDESMF